MPRKFTLLESGARRTPPVELALLFDAGGSVAGAGLLDPEAINATVLDAWRAADSARSWPGSRRK